MEFEDSFYDTKDYKLLDKELGKGTFGTVYLAENINNHQKYAVKVINTTEGFDGQEQMLFVRKSLLLRKLEHLSIVKFIGINFKSFKDPTKLEPTIITEYYPHGSLKDILSKEMKSLSDPNWDSTKKYITLLGISDAMRYLHKHGISHYNLKPENILFDDNYCPHICDFGFSNLIRLNTANQIGTLLYMAPEILRGETKLSTAVDVYAFGILAYEIITGKVPYYEFGETISPFILTNKVIDGYRPQFTSNVPYKIQKLIEKCWSQTPENRPSFDEIFEALSSNLTYQEGTIEEEKVSEYINMLKIKRREDKSASFCKKEQQVFEITNDDFITGLDGIHSARASIQEAVSSLERSSEQGNCYSSYLLGLLYEKGELIKTDPQKSISYFERSGDQGNPRGYSAIAYKYQHRIGIKQDCLKSVECNPKEVNPDKKATMSNLSVLHEKGIKDDEKDYSKALEFYQRAAEFGDARAITNLGVLYSEGKGVSQDFSKAFEYFQRAVSLGDSFAMTNLGILYEEGKGVNQDYSKAIEYYKKAADLGDNIAMKNLGVLYEKGSGVKQDYNKAIEYYQKAADLGNAIAMKNLGVLYKDGLGVKQDNKKALEFYQKASDLGDVNAMTDLGVLYKEGKRVRQDYKKALEYFQKAADHNPNAITNLGILYEEGKGVKLSYSKAFEYYQKAAELGDPAGIFRIGSCYMKKIGVKQNYSKAIEYYKKAAELGFPGAFNNFGILYSGGKGVKKNIPKAIECYKKAADLGNINALYNLGYLYSEREDVEKDIPKAIEYYQKASDHGDLEATTNLGIIYEQGNGVMKDYSKALKYYKKAESLGSSNGINNLGSMYEEGRGVMRDDSKAIKYYQKAADMGNDLAIQNLNRMKNKQSKSIFSLLNIFNFF